MMRLYLLLFILPHYLNFAMAQTPYAASAIPENLTENAVAVVRLEEQVFDISGPAKAQMRYKKAITIMNKRGEEYAYIAEIYDKFSSVSGMKAALYDAAGKKIKEFKKTDFKDRSLISNYSIYEDNRIKYLDVNHISYPYTLEYNYVKEYKGFLIIPRWKPVESFEMSVEKSSYTILCDPDYKFKKLTGNHVFADSSRAGNKMKYNWTCHDVEAIVHEPMTIGMDNLTPWVMASPMQFEYDNSAGKLDDWPSLGHWMHSLSEGCDGLSEAAVSRVRDMVREAKDDKEKISLLYEYLQQHTRYVSVQLGIGSFKPMTAESVAQVHYGDCKALSNYMKALLKAVGIKSHLVVIGSGMPNLKPDYASFGQTNHMILCIPLEKDTTFLECTSQYYPMGFVGHSNANRNVLMVDASQSKLIKMPQYQAADNYQKRKISVTFEGDEAHMAIVTRYGNAQFENNLRALIREPVEQRKIILEELGIPDAILVDYRYSREDNSLPELTENLTVSSRQVLSKGGGDRVFITANLLNRRESVPRKVPDRKTHFAVGFEYLDEDEITYDLPSGYHVEHLPGNTEIESEFGVYSAHYSMEGNRLRYYRTQMMNSKRYPPEKYGDFVDFYKQIYQADRQKVVLIKAL